MHTTILYMYLYVFICIYSYVNEYICRHACVYMTIGILTYGDTRNFNTELTEPTRQIKTTFPMNIG